MKKIIVIVGPTSVGKTEISIELANKCNGEIISADSMQIYKDMDIGTAKVKEDEKKGIAHHLIDIIKPNEDYSVSDFKKDCKEKIEKIFEKNKQPIIVGGTGLYINSIVYDLNFTEAPSDIEIRNRYEQFENEYLYKKLKEIDFQSYERINLKDRKRIIRALEIFEITGKKMSEQYSNFRKENNDYKYIYIALNTDREKLYENINLRVDKMLEEGLIEEVRNLVKNGYSIEDNSMKAIGYKEVLEYIQGEIEYNEMVEKLKRNSRRYAKRQITWFKRDERVKWFFRDKSSKEEIIEEIIDMYTRRENENK